MKTLLKTSTSAVVIGLFLASSAHSADILRSTKDTPEPYAAPAGTSVNWTGVYVGGQVGYGNSNHNLKYDDTIDLGKCASAAPVPVTKAAIVDPASYYYNETDCTKANATNVWTSDVQSAASAFIDGLNSHGIFGGGTIGADIQRGHLLFGVFGDYNFSQAETQAGISFGGTSVGTASIEEGDSWVIAARAGYLFGQEKRALLYVLGGYGQSDVTYTVGTDSKDVTFSGFVAGAGGEYALSQNVFLGIEYQHFFGGEETLFSDDGHAGGAHGFATNSKLTDELDTDRVMVKLKLKLNGDLPNLSY